MERLAEAGQELGRHLFMQTFPDDDAKSFLENEGPLTTVALLEVAANTPDPVSSDLAIEVAVYVVEGVVAFAHG